MNPARTQPAIIPMVTSFDRGRRRAAGKPPDSTLRAPLLVSEAPQDPQDVAPGGERGARPLLEGRDRVDELERLGVEVVAAGALARVGAAVALLPAVLPGAALDGDGD